MMFYPSLNLVFLRDALPCLSCSDTQNNSGLLDSQTCGLSVGGRDMHWGSLHELQVEPVTGST